MIYQPHACFSFYEYVDVPAPKSSSTKRTTAEWNSNLGNPDTKIIAYLGMYLIQPVNGFFVLDVI